MNIVCISVLLNPEIFSGVMNDRPTQPIILIVITDRRQPDSSDSAHRPDVHLYIACTSISHPHQPPLQPASAPVLSRLRESVPKQSVLGRNALILAPSCLSTLLRDRTTASML